MSRQGTARVYATARRPGTGHGLVVDSVNVSVFAYVPVRSGSFAPIAWGDATSTTSLDAGALHADRESETPSGCARANAPFARWPPLTDSAASPALDVTV